MTDFDLEESQEEPVPSLEDVIAALQAGGEQATSAVVLYGLSGITDAQITQVEPVWQGVEPKFRQKLMRMMADVSEMNFEISYRNMGYIGLDDPDPSVRVAAIDVLWEAESLDLMNRLIGLAKNDESSEVRAEAVKGLGRFILLGEYEEVPETNVLLAQDTVIKLLDDDTQPVDVRRRALESIGNCTHTIVPEAIHEAYHSADSSLRVSALFAMGRTCDTRWESIVLEELDSDDPAMLYEAARASGELQLPAAVPKLYELFEAADSEIQDAVVWSLGEIGTSQSVEALDKIASQLNEEKDEDLLEVVEDAIASASFLLQNEHLLTELD